MTPAALPLRKRRVLVVTGLYPTADSPSTGTFVQRRLEGVDCVVVAARTYAQPMVVRYLRLMWRAVTVRGRFAAVEAHVLFPAGLIGLLAARLRGIPLIVYAHGSDVWETAQQNRVYRFLARWVAREADAVATNSMATADLIRELGREAVVIPPGVDLEKFKPSPRPRDRRVLYIGGARVHKGYDVARELADTCAGPDLDVIPPDDVPAVLAAHDIVLVPSRREAFGLVAAEAIASGRWVVASDVDGLREVVTDGVNGTLVRDGDYASAIAAVPDYDPDAVAATAAWFDWRLHREQMAELLEQALSTRCSA